MFECKMTDILVVRDEVVETGCCTRNWMLDILAFCILQQRKCSAPPSRRRYYSGAAQLQFPY
jgi:hypothetical protein